MVPYTTPGRRKKSGALSLPRLCLFGNLIIALEPESFELTNKTPIHYTIYKQVTLNNSTTFSENTSPYKINFIQHPCELRIYC